MVEPEPAGERSAQHALRRQGMRYAAIAFSFAILTAVLSLLSGSRWGVFFLLVVTLPAAGIGFTVLHFARRT